MDIRQHAFLAMPKDSGTSWVERGGLPLLPPPFLTVRHVKTDTGWNPDINAVLQLKVIAKVFDACDTIIAATDASREGEMLFRYLYRFLGCKQPCLRLWISSLTDEAITRGMENLRPCALFDNLFLAADSRNKGRLASGGQFKLCRLQGGRLRKQFAGQGADPCTGGHKRTVPGEGEPHSR